MTKPKAHRKDYDDHSRPLSLTSSAGSHDPRLAELVRLLARRAAREWYDQQSGERRQPRS